MWPQRNDLRSMWSTSFSLSQTWCRVMASQSVTVRSFFMSKPP